MKDAPPLTPDAPEAELDAFVERRVPGDFGGQTENVASNGRVEMRQHAFFVAVFRRQVHGRVPIRVRQIVIRPVQNQGLTEQERSKISETDTGNVRE